MITTTNYTLLRLDINEMPQKIPNDLIGKDLIHEMTSDTHESVMKSSVLIPDNSLRNSTAQNGRILSVKERRRKNTVNI